MCFFVGVVADGGGYAQGAFAEVGVEAGSGYEVRYLEFRCGVEVDGAEYSGESEHVLGFEK